MVIAQAQQMVGVVLQESVTMPSDEVKRRELIEREQERLEDVQSKT
jgi:hypothetical protein